MSRLNWANTRQSPTDQDDITPQEPSFEFDHRRNILGGDSWPKGFGPSTVGKAWKAGLVVIAEIAGYPHPVAAVETRWNKAKVLEVKDQGGWHIPERLYTRKSVKGLMATGELLEEK